MSKKIDNPFVFLFSGDSDTQSASEGEMTSSQKCVKKRKVSATNVDSDVQILKVEAGRNQRQVEIIKVERPVQKSPEVKIIKVVPGTSTETCSTERKMNLPIQCRKLHVEGFVGKPTTAGTLFEIYENSLKFNFINEYNKCNM